MGKWLENLGQAVGGQAAGGIVNEGMGLLTQGLKNKQQVKQQARLNSVNSDTAKHMAMFNYDLEMKKWRDTNYSAQMAEMKKAGLNPGLMYGMSGGGGVSSQTQGGQMPSTGADTAKASGGTEGMGMMMGQMALLQAQKDNIEANTAKTIAETDKTKGVDTDKTKAEIGILKLDKSFFEQTFDARMEELDRRIEKTRNESREIDQRVGITGETREATVNKAIAESLGAVLENILIGAKINATEQDINESKQRVEQMKAQIDKWSEEVKQGWKELSLREKQLKLDGIMKEVETVSKTRGLTELPALTPIQRRQVIDQIDNIAEIGKQK